MKEQLNKARGLAVAGITAMVFCFTSCGVEVGNPGSVTLVTRPPASVSGYQIVDAANRRVRIPGDITSIVPTELVFRLIRLIKKEKITRPMARGEVLLHHPLGLETDVVIDSDALEHLS